MPAVKENILKIILSYIRLFFVIIITIISSLFVIIFTGLFRINQSFHPSIRLWADLVLWFSGVRLKIEYSGEKPPKGRYIFASNHSSLYDIPIMLSALRTNLRIIYKKELEKVPIFGYGLKVSPLISINRDDPREAMNSLEEAVESIRNGDSVMIYPEGTRSADGKLQPFKRGVFLLAARSGRPIVPVTIVGSWKIIRPGTRTINPSEIRFVIHPPIENNASDKAKEKELMQKVHQKIAQSL